MSKGLSIQLLLEPNEAMRANLDQELDNLALDLEREIERQVGHDDVIAIINQNTLVLKLRVGEDNVETSLLSQEVLSKSIKISDLEEMGFVDQIKELQSAGVTKRLKEDHINELSEEAKSFIITYKHLQYYRENVSDLVFNLFDNLGIHPKSMAA